MSKYRTQNFVRCPYCNMAGFSKKGQMVAHIKKSHSDKWKEFQRMVGKSGRIQRHGK